MKTFVLDGNNFSDMVLALLEIMLNHDNSHHDVKVELIR